ncbi:hypothetical protein PIB30_066888 [Stylosanthes scabra]|uniref:Uncharacterized protein n=1 Tax=Stylosanthes scabra TaxID=79078 RepID=A0ABU6TM81_9FABA|nr:hypothetical protein [Stylosanthes scabra]
MHDLISDLAQYVAGDFYFNLDDNSKRNENLIRHLSYTQSHGDFADKFEPFSHLEKLRTFLPFQSSAGNSTYSFPAAVGNFLKKKNPLRVLSLSRYAIAGTQVSPGNSLHLRYLNLSHTTIEELPDFVCECYNLETLILSSCGSLRKLPIQIVKLVLLRHLDIRGSSVTEMPAYFGELKSLQMLTSFVVSNNDQGSKIDELGKLTDLHGSLLIDNLQNLASSTEASSAGLSSKQYLHELEFKWSSYTNIQQSQDSVLDYLKPHENVKRLKIQNFAGNSLPNWLGNAAFSRMVFLQLEKCKNCSLVPPLGELPSLKELHIIKMKNLRMVGSDFYGNTTEPFKSLKIIKFEKMQNWQVWEPFNQGAGFPSLEELYIDGCPNLVGRLPDQLLSLSILGIEACDQLESLPLAGLTSLSCLTIKACRKLKHLYETNQEFQQMIGNLQGALSII